MSTDEIPANENFSGSIPECYDRFLGQSFFAPFAGDLAERAAIFVPHNVLEFAAGTGILTQQLASRLPNARLLATDLNEPMLARAQQRTAHLPNITYAAANAQKTELQGGGFDLIVHQFGVMFFPDRAAHYKEALRLLKPGGHLMFNTYDKLEFNDFPRIAEETLLELYPDVPLRFISRFPHGYYDKAIIGGELRQAGFSAIKIDTVVKRCLSSNARAVAQGLCLGTPVRGEILARDPDGLDRAVDAIAGAIAARFGAGGVDGHMQAYVVTASR